MKHDPHVNAVLIGLDIGGSKIMAAAADAHGTILRRARQPTPATLPDGLNLLLHTARELAHGQTIAGVGAAIGGPIDAATGVVSPLHQPAWRSVPLREIIQRELHAPFRVEVDTDAAALAERLVGGNLAPRLVYLTISTGVGGGFLIDGEIYRGHHGAHPEFGHIAVPCPDLPHPPPCDCGAAGCLEALISGTAIRRLYGQPAENLTHHQWSLVAQHLGRGLATLATVLAPDAIILGGGVALGGGQTLLAAARSTMLTHLRLVPPPTLQLSALHHDTPLHGAITLARLAATPSPPPPNPGLPTPLPQGGARGG